MKFPSTLRVAIVPNLDIFRINKTSRGYIEIVGGQEGSFLNLLSESLRFSYRVQIPDDGEWGVTRNGTWTGIIGLVSTNEADIGLSKLSINPQRLSAVDFSFPYTIDPVGFATRPPGLLSKETVLTFPFSGEVWISLLIAVMFITFAFKLILRHNYTLQYLLLYVIGCIFEKFLRIKTSKSRERLLVSAWQLSAMLLTYSYVAVMLSFITFPIKEKPVDTKFLLKGALDKGSFKCATLRGSDILSSLLDSEDETVATIARHIEKNDRLINPTKDNFIDIFNQDRTAFIIGRSNFRLVRPDNIFLAKDSFYTHFFSIAINKNFCCKESLNNMIHRITAAGLYDKNVNDFFFRSWLENKEIRTQESNGYKALKLNDVVSVFHLLLFGYLLAIMCLILESLHCNRLLMPLKTSLCTRFKSFAKN